MDRPRHMTFFLQKFSPTLEKLSAAGKSVYFMHDVPKLTDKKIILKKLLEIRHTPEKDYYLTIPLTQKTEEQKFAKTIEGLQKKYNFKILDPKLKYFTAQDKIIIIKDSEFIYSDDNHLTDFGSLHFREVFLPLMQDILEKNLR